LVTINTAKTPAITANGHMAHETNLKATAKHP